MSRENVGAVTIREDEMVARLLALKPFLEAHHCSSAVIDEAIAALSSEILREVLSELEKAEARYRYAHDILGTGDPKTGRAWDLMKRAGDKARAALDTGVMGG